MRHHPAKCDTPVWQPQCRGSHVTQTSRPPHTAKCALSRTTNACETCLQRLPEHPGGTTAIPCKHQELSVHNEPTCAASTGTAGERMPARCSGTCPPSTGPSCPPATAAACPPASVAGLPSAAHTWEKGAVSAEPGSAPASGGELCGRKPPRDGSAMSVCSTRPLAAAYHTVRGTQQP